MLGEAILKRAGNLLGAGALGTKGFSWKKGNVIPGQCAAALLRAGDAGSFGRSDDVRAQERQSPSMHPLLWLKV